MSKITLAIGYKYKSITQVTIGFILSIIILSILGAFFGVSVGLMSGAFFVRMNDWAIIGWIFMGAFALWVIIDLIKAAIFEGIPLKMAAGLAIIGAINGTIVGAIFMNTNSFLAAIGTPVIIVSILWAICGALAATSE